jgi:DNA polymerase elongation subunit (family B)
MMTSFYTSVERYGKNILWRGYENGKRFSYKVPYKPTLYLSSNKAGEEGFTPLKGNSKISPHQFGSMAESKDFIEEYKGVSNMKIYGNTNYITQFIQESYPDDIKYDIKDVNIVSFDIEVDIADGYPNVEYADKEITSIAYKSSKSSKYFLLGRKDYDKTQTVTGIDPDDIVFIKFDNEMQLLRRFVELWVADYPDIVTGWNVQYFDIQYLVTRIMSLMGEDVAARLSPWKNVNKYNREFFGKMQSSYNISGVSVIDYMDCFKKFGYKYGPQESFKLDHIAYVVLGEKKLDYS